VLRGTARFIDEHRRDLQARFLAESPWWRPEAIDRRIFNSLVDGALHLFDEIVADPGHPLRAEVDRQLETLIAKLETSPALQARIVRAKDELLGGHLPQLATPAPRWLPRRPIRTRSCAPGWPRCWPPPDGG
jgi:uncharacterized membrane-anchored protein YjiN (DUF445 family)